MRLLDFKPNAINGTTDSTVTNNIRRELEDMVHQDISFNLTPDLPALRYAGPQLVFIWDGFKDPTTWGGRLGKLKNTKDYEVVEFAAITKDKYVPFRNRIQPGHDPQFFCDTMEGWWEMCEDGPIASVDLTPRQLSGKLLRVGVKGMSALDRAMSNTIRCHRMLVDVWPDHKRGPNHSRKAWMYVNQTEDFATYDPHRQRYVFNPGVQPMSMRTEIIQGTTCYHYNHLAVVGNVKEAS